MKKWTWFCIVLISILLTACGTNPGPAAPSVSDRVTPTGYPSDEVQRASVFYNGALYLYSAEGVDLPLEAGFEKVGTVSDVNNAEYPSEEFHGSRLETGQEVYASQAIPEKLYVKYDRGFGLFERDTYGSNPADETSSEYDIMISNENVYDVEKAVSATILHENKERYLPGECMGEGHTILKKEEEGDLVKVYLLAMFGWYQFQDGNLVKNSGSGAIPTVISLTRVEDGSYLLKDYETAQDGSLYVPSIKKMFPEELWDICSSYSADRVRILTQQEQKYAAAYLKKIGREATIGDYSDFKHTLLTDEGVSVDVSNLLLEKESRISNYPSWIGNLEQVENGVRYRYEKSYDSWKKEVIYTKTDVRTNTIVEEDIFNSENAVLISHRNAADRNAVQFEAMLNSLNGVTMEVTGGSAGAGSVKLRLLNETDLNIIFGESYEIQNYQDGYWHSVPYIIDNWIFYDVAYQLKKDVPQEITIDWKTFHGYQEPGKYRILKTVTDFRGTGDYTEYYMGAEFEIKSQAE
ncbi:immunoglobulin-like domain-containing protein [Hungatella sp.]|uniref:immunoglobulin-like domain-containing protein n=1 Tax=Hungatella sp. TaxID=2613924 RepID=UPI003AB36534